MLQANPENPDDQRGIRVTLSEIIHIDSMDRFCKQAVEDLVEELSWMGKWISVITRATRLPKPACSRYEHCLVEITGPNKAAHIIHDHLIGSIRGLAELGPPSTPKYKTKPNCWWCQ